MNKNDENKKILIELEEKISYTFKDKALLVLALTHSSYANDVKKAVSKSNERLEFLGDALLNLVISEKIFNECNELAEGELTKVRANIIRESSLLKCAELIGMGKYLFLGKGEELSGGRQKSSILADSVEALIGSIFCDSNLNEVKRFIFEYMGKTIEDSIKGNIFHDFKTKLQESYQKNGENKISYQIIEESGPSHNKTLTVSVKVDDKVLGVGKGNSKKEAEQNAAKSALEKI